MKEECPRGLSRELPIPKARETSEPTAYVSKRAKSKVRASQQLTKHPFFSFLNTQALKTQEPYLRASTALVI